MDLLERAHGGTIPMSGATYRLQLHAGFDFDDASAVVPLLADLGITSVYASPIFQAVPGSTHGYDVTDPTRISDELGGSGGFANFLGALRSASLGLLIDIVPNHMATHPDNQWWWDVLEDGPSSVGAAFFDIDWAGGGDASSFTVLVPVLGDHYGRVIEAGDIRIVRDGARCIVHYGDHRLPISPRTLDDILGPAGRAGASAELAELSDGFASLPDARLTDALAVAERHQHKQELSRQLLDLVTRSDDVGSAIDDELDRINGDPDRLDALLRRQNYRLARWRTASEELDYRRFFSIESLVGVRIEDPAVLEATHPLVKQLLAEQAIDGLRIDHVDGLRDPAGYLEQVRSFAGAAPLYVEKILAVDEPLPSWPVQGTTGYEFLNWVDGLLVSSANEQAFTDAYVELTGSEPDFETVAREAKKEVMSNELAAEVERSTLQLMGICEGHRRHRDHTLSELRDALVELVASFDVYRTYLRPGEMASDADLDVLRRARDRTVEARPDIDVELLDFLTGLAAGGGADDAELDLCYRLQQLTAPVMAKGVEDTAFYRYLRLISLNEVGGEPASFGRSISAFHEAMADLAQRWPDTMLTLSTHDTKRSADVRARIHVLSEEPEAWRVAVEAWMDHNDRHWAGGSPDRSAEYLLYQTLVGAWPIDIDRTAAFMEKALREAKVCTSWTDPDEGYEASVQQFVRNVLGDSPWVGRFEEFLASTDLVERGQRNSLVQMTLLLTCPGNPDLYQGAERWDLSLTDPDNRRPVDFSATRALLDSPDGDVLGNGSPLGDGSKVSLVRRLLHLRQSRPELFDHSGYEPIDLAGGDDAGAVAFRRGDMVVVAATRSTGPTSDPVLSLTGDGWRNVLTDQSVEAGDHQVADLLGRLPVAVLLAEGH